MNFIFDFDGTIADSLPAFVAVFNKSVRDNKDPLTTAEIERLRNLPSRRALKSAGVRWWQIPKLVVQGIPDFHALVPGLDTFSGLPDTIKALHKRGDKLYIVTSNTHESVEVFLAKHKLTKYFEDILTGAGLFNKSKYIRKLMKNNNLKRRETIYIGDETRDVQAARIALIKAVSVTWGFNTKKILKKQRPNYLIDTPSQLLDLGATK